MYRLLVVLLFALLLAQGSSAIPLTPEEFLVQLADSSTGHSGARFWFDRFSPESDQEKPSLEQVTELLADKVDLSVVPGRSNLVEVDSVRHSYRVEFPESEWAWLDSTGRVLRSRGVAVIDFTEGRFYWSSLPLVPIEFATSDRLKIGMLLTVVTLIVAGFIILLARRMLLR